MKLEEAIKIAEHNDDTFQTYTVTIRNRALKLLIEAGKREMEYRPKTHPRDFDLLPGETE